MNNNSRKVIAKIISLGLVSMLAFATPIVSWASADEHGMGYVQPDVEINYVGESNDESNEASEGSNADNGDSALLTSGTHAAKYDPREESWYDGIAIKDQASTGLCWCYGTTTAMEISYTKESGGSVDEISPGHLGYFAYNRSSTLTNSLGMLAGCTTTNHNEWEDWYALGGNAYYAFVTLSNRLGAAKESDASTAWKDNPSILRSKYDDSLAYDDYLTLENATLIEDATTDEIKSLIEECGAVTTAIYYPDYTSAYMKKISGTSSEYSLYVGYGSSSNHLVTIIGWDDNFSKNNFVSKPSSDGAWLIQNSWGDDYYTYLWTSYEDVFVNETICGFNMKEAEGNEYVFEHDGTANTSTVTLEEGYSMANVYTVGSDADYELKSIGFTEYNQGNLSYNIKVYTALSSATDPTSGTLASSTTVTTDYTGYNTYDLAEPVLLEKGTSYSISITPDLSSGDECTLGIDQSGTMGYNRNKITFSPLVGSGKTFYTKNSTKWYDCSSYVARIKGIATKVGELTAVKAKAASLTEDGNTAYWKDDDGNYYADELGETPIDENSWVIKKIDTVTISPTSYESDGTAKEPVVTAKDSAGTVLVKGTDYDVTYENNVNPGTATAVVTFKGKYTGSKTLEFTITGNATLSGTVSGYSGSNLKLTLEDADGNTRTATTQSFSWRDLECGTYTLTAEADGDYVTREYDISIAKTDTSVVQNVELRQLGDADCDGERKAADITKLARHVAKISIEKDPYIIKLLDTDRDDVVKAEDITHLARFVAKIIEEL